MHVTQIKDNYVCEYLELVAVGASHEEAVAQVAQSNEVNLSEVEAGCASN